MDNYIVSARKYRPSTFQSVVGQLALTTTLKNAISSNKLAHAYLFCGPRGVGKTTCARIFGKTINCLQPTVNGEACNECESCKAFNEQRSFNIHELDAASNNSVDDIRSLIEQVRIPPQIGKYKVYIIDEVHMLSSSAFNAFLKTLEEPPHHAIFILATTEKHKILPTILSRCQIYDFIRISITDIVEHLKYVASQENIHAEDEALNVLAQKADGGMRDALSIFDQLVSFTGGNITYKAVIDNLNVLDYEYYFKLTEAVLNNNVVDALLIYNDILNRGFDGHNIISGIASHFRDLLLCKDARTTDLFEVSLSVKAKYVETAKNCTNEFLYKAIDIVNECDLNYKQSRNKRLIAELTLIKICQLTSDSVNRIENEKEVIKPVVPVAKDTEPVKEIVSFNKDIPPAPELNQEKIKEPAQTTSMPKSITGLGVSISSLTQKKEEEKSTSEKNESIVLSQTFTPLDLINEWKSYTQLIQEDHHLKNTMLNCLPNLLSKEKFEVVVNNPVQEQKLTECSQQILSVLKQKLKNTNIKMEIRLTVDNEKKLAFTPMEKFKLMTEQNESLLKLKDEFGLELS